MFTKITNKHGLLTKEFSKDMNGKIKKKTNGMLSNGSIEKINIPLKELDNFLNALDPHSAILLGTTSSSSSEIGASRNLLDGEIARTKDNFTFDESDFILFDIDNNMKPEEAIAELVKLDPMLATAEMLVRYGTSSYIYDGEKCFTESSSLHIYVSVTDIDQIDTYVKSLKGKSWEIGSAFIKLNAIGAMMSRYVFDAVVFSPERLIFEAGAICKDGLSQRKPKSIYREGIPLNLSAFPYDKSKASMNEINARKVLSQEGKILRKAYENNYAVIAKEQGISDKEIFNDVTALSNGTINSKFVLRDLQDKTFFAGTINAQMDKRLIQDPIIPTGEQKAIIYWNDGKPMIHSFKSGVFKVALLGLKEQDIFDNKGKGYEYDNKDRLIPTLDNLKTLMHQNNIEYSYDLLKKNPRLLHSDVNWDAPNPEKRSEQVVKDIALRMGMPVAIIDTIDSLSNEDEYQKNPVMDMVKDGHKKWQNNQEDWISKLVEVLQPQSDINHELVSKWLIQCVAAWDFEGLSPLNTKQASFENVLTLQGKQGLRKTTFFRKLLPTGMENYFKEGAMLNPDNKDSVKQCTSYAMVELGELESTFNKSDNGALKAFLSNRYDEYRLPYARKEETHRRSVSFCGSVNDNQFLRDRSGSRRFWIIPVTDINMELMESIPKDELWGQAFDLYLKNKPWFLNTTSETYKKLEKVHEVFEAYSPSHDVLAYISECIAKKAPKIRMSASKMYKELHINKVKADIDALAMKLEKEGYHRNPDRTFNVPWIMTNLM